MSDTTQSGGFTGRQQASRVFERFSRPLVSVARNDVPWGFVGGMALIVVLAVIVFVSLSQSRTAHASTAPKPVPVAAAKPPAPAPYVARVISIAPPPPVIAAPENSGRLGA